MNSNNSISSNSNPVNNNSGIEDSSKKEVSNTTMKAATIGSNLLNVALIGVGMSVAVPLVAVAMPITVAAVSVVLPVILFTVSVAVYITASLFFCWSTYHTFLFVFTQAQNLTSYLTGRAPLSISSIEENLIETDDDEEKGEIINHKALSDQPPVHIDQIVGDLGQLQSAITLFQNKVNDANYVVGMNDIKEIVDMYKKQEEINKQLASLVPDHPDSPDNNDNNDKLEAQKKIYADCHQSIEDIWTTVKNKYNPNIVVNPPAPNAPLVPSRQFTPPSLGNIGNSCYLNSVLQCLLALDSVLPRLDLGSLPNLEIDQHLPLKKCSKLLKIHEAFGSVMNDSQTNPGNVVSSIRSLRDLLFDSKVDQNFPKREKRDQMDAAVVVEFILSNFFQDMMYESKKSASISDQPDQKQSLGKDKMSVLQLALNENAPSKRFPKLGLFALLKKLGFEKEAEIIGEKSSSIVDCVEDKESELYGAPSQLSSSETSALEGLFSRFGQHCKTDEKKSPMLDTIIQETLNEVVDQTNWKEGEKTQVLGSYPDKYATTQTFTHLPKMLTIQLKRFGSVDGHSFKISEEISLPEDGIVDFSKYIDEPNSDKSLARYKIKGMITHHGRGISSGHYTSSVCYGEKYYDCDDNHIRSMSKEEFLGQKNPYMIFLEQIEPEQAVS